MKHLSKQKRHYAFIDSQNLNLSILHQGWKLDFTSFRKYLEDTYRIQKAFLFLGYIPENEELYTSLRKSGFELIFKPVTHSRSKKVKGNVDTDLVLYAAAIEAKNYDKAIVVTGDGDFQCLIEYLKKQNKLLKLFVPNAYKYSSLLKIFKADTIFMNALRTTLAQ